MKAEVSKILTHRMMKRMLSIAALLLVATASMANAPKPEPKPEPQAPEYRCIPVHISCDRGYLDGKMCGHASTQELLQEANDLAERFCHGSRRTEE